MSGSNFAPVTGIDQGGRVAFGSDERLWVKFVRKSVRNAYKSDQEGRPIYDPIDFIQIQQPGERDMLVRPVKEEDKHRFPKHWEAYQTKQEQTPEGTPVQLLFPNEPHISDLMLDLRIMTVEQLAQLSEQGITRLGMDGRKYVAKAQAALDQAAATKEVSRLTRELEEANERARLAQEAMGQLQQRVDGLETKLARVLSEDEPEMELVPRRRGRSPKPQPEQPLDPGPGRDPADQLVG